MQASEAELIFNRYRRDGHQFSVSVYNKLLQCWVKKASKVTVQVYMYQYVAPISVYTCTCVVLLSLVHSYSGTPLIKILLAKQKD